MRASRVSASTSDGRMSLPVAALDSSEPSGARSPSSQRWSQVSTEPSRSTRMTPAGTPTGASWAYAPDGASRPASTARRRAHCPTGPPERSRPRAPRCRPRDPQLRRLWRALPPGRALRPPPPRRCLPRRDRFRGRPARVANSVDARDLKSPDLRVVRVRISARALRLRNERAGHPLHPTRIFRPFPGQRQ